MVLCKFFLQNSCRFGSKCNNEHIDIKQIIKTDIESAINGRQWPFSCFGPFKDKPCVPNLVDQSFEEIRLMCYEAKQKNYFEQFDKQFKEQAMDATNKMMSLLSNSLDVIINLYDTPIENGSSASAMKSNNPFGLAATQSNTSLFNKPTASAGNIFGGGNFNTTTTTNNNLFSGGQQQQQQQSGNIFGGSSNTSNFGGGQTTNQAAPTFFQQTVAAVNPTNSVFGGGSTTQSSLFGGGNIATNNIFGQAAQQTGMSTTGGNLFGQKPQTGFGMFGQSNPQQQQQQQQNNMFAQTMQMNGNSIFAQPLNQMQTQARPMAENNIFAQAAQQIQPQQGLFQQAMDQTQMQTNSQMGASQPSMVSLQAYSNMEDLTGDEIEAFKAERFLPGKLPLKPPPRELIN